MAKASKKSAGRPAMADETARTTIVNLKGTPDYAAWLDGIHKKTRIPKAVIFRVALEEWAKRNGHPSPPSL